jgi:two-component system sensor histidine kinase/response regulator
MNASTINYQTDLEQTAKQKLDVKKRSDKLMNYFLIGFFAGGLGLAFFFDTWLIAFGVGGSLLVAYYSTKIALPNSDLYQYVLSVVLALFMAQYIYQMHGMFEMHFFAFIGSAILITYQNWKLQIPILIVVGLHHATLGYLQNIGYAKVFFSQLAYFDIVTFTIHIILAGIIFFICGLWAYQLKIYNADLRKINNELNKARIEAEAASKEKSIFLATMSHEIRTPMNGVIGMSAMLAETPLNEQQREYTNTIITCGESLLNVINDVLDFSKIESGNMELEKEDLLLRSCIEDVLDIFGTKSAQIGLDLLYQMEDNVPVQISGDVLRLRQILINLVGNAIKFTKEGEVFVGVRTLTTAANDYELQFEVRDTGIGIPADKMLRLFKSFSQVDPSTTRKYGGTGLGLAIAQKLVALMGGRIWVESESGKGSSFFFTIQTSKGNSIMPVITNQNMAKHKGKKVLVIDDNPTNLFILKSQLLQWNLQPTLASSGQEALEILSKDQQFDLLLTDMQMPEMDGVTLAQHIKDRHVHIPVTLLSSIGDAVSKENRQLFISVLTKPIKHHVLCKHIINGFDHQQKAPSEETTIHEKLPHNFSQKYPLHILVAEDNVFNQQVIIHILNKMGYQPRVVENGELAVLASREENYDVILMDMQMPEMDGIEATQIIRQTLPIQPVIIALTANTMHGDEEKCIEAGMNDYIGKPIKLEEVVSKLEKWALYNKAS